MPSSAQASSIHSSRRPDGRYSAAAATRWRAEPAQLPDRKDLRQRHLARNPERAAGVRAAGAAPARGADPYRGRCVRRGVLRGERQRHGDGQGGRAHRFPGRGGSGGNLFRAQRRRAGARSAARHRLPDDPVPVPARDHLGPHHARRVSAGAARARVVRGALCPAPAAARRSAAGQRAEDRTRPVTKVAVLRAGAWGTAIAAVLSARLEVALWARDPAQAAALSSTRQNARYLPGIALPAGVEVQADLDQAINAASLVLAATPVAGLREVLPKVKAPLVWLCKGFEEGTGLMPHEVAAQTMGAQARCGALSGPSFAAEVARGLPCALTLASADAVFAREAAATLHGGRMRVYYSTDLVGVEIGGAVKNVMAIAAGISDGLGLGLNARAALVTRGLAEMARLGAALGGRPETLFGLAGAGDLILTATGELSRNRRVGLELAAGRGLAEILARLGHVAEGVRSAKEVARIARARGVDMPVSDAVNAVLDGSLRPAAAVERLLSRDPKQER